MRDYQNECVEAFDKAIESGRRNVLVVLPTGAGKTFLFSHIAKKLNLPTLILAHRTELITQAADKLRMIWPKVDIGVVKGERNETDHQVIVASTQTLMREERRITLPQLGFIVYDEAHHAASNRNKEILSSIRSPSTIVLGVTATPNRTDQRSLGAMFSDAYGQGPIYERTILEMISEGYLSEIKGINGNLQVELTNVSMAAGDYQLASLSRVMNTPQVNKAMYEFWKFHAKERKTIVFATDIKHAKDLTDEFCKHGIRAQYITGQLSESKRDELLRDFSNNVIQVMINCNVLTEGFDEPSVDCILFARPTKSKGLFTQMLGRGLRLFPGKENCLVLDSVRNTKKHNLINVSDLFPKSKPKPKKREEQLEEHNDKHQAEDEIYIGHAWFESQSAEVYTSRFNWKKTDNSGFSLPLIGGEIRIEKKPQGWFPVMIDANGQQSLLYDQPLSIEFAMGVAEDKVRQMQLGGFAKKDAKWRSEAASRSQVDALRKWGIPVLEELTKDQADQILRDLIKEKKRRQSLLAIQ